MSQDLTKLHRSVIICDMKKGTGTWYTEKATTTAPSEIQGMEWIVRCGKRIALVPIKKEA